MASSFEFACIAAPEGEVSGYDKSVAEEWSGPGVAGRELECVVELAEGEQAAAGTVAAEARSRYTWLNITFSRESVVGLVLRWGRSVLTLQGAPANGAEAGHDEVHAARGGVHPLPGAPEAQLVTRGSGAGVVAKPGDQVLFKHKGRRFWSQVEGTAKKGLRVCGRRGKPWFVPWNGVVEVRHA